MPELQISHKRCFTVRNEEKTARKFRIANGISFACFGAYYLSFFVLAVIAGRAACLTAAFLPTIALAGLLINVAVKYRHAGTGGIAKAAKTAGFLSFLMNGYSYPAACAADTDWSQKEKDIRRYPSIVPAWLFAGTFLNFVNFFMPLIASGTPFTDGEVRLLIVFYCISTVFLMIGQVSSTFALIYAGEKEYAVRSWKTIGIICVLFAAAVLIGILASRF